MRAEQACSEDQSIEAAGLHGRLKGWYVQIAEDSVRGTGALEGESTGIDVGDTAHRLGQAQTVVHESCRS